jgi:3-oxoacyl-[acyl-carrier-protein] synthase II
LNRRVVVTGVGLVCGCGIGTEEVWRNLLAGKSGIRAITHFDATAFDCRIAGEVRDFDPLHWLEKKELKKTGRFIQLALAAADFAMQMSGLKVTPEIADSTGVYIGSGIGGFDVIEREHSKYLAGGPGKISPFFIPFVTARKARTRPPPQPAPLPRTPSVTPSKLFSAARRT